MLTLMALSVAGCERAWWTGFLDPTQVGRFEPGAKKREVRRTLGLLIDEPEVGPGATEPTSEDLAAQYEEPTIGPGDVVEVSVLDLLEPGQEYRVQLPVNEVGYVTLAELGQVKIGEKKPSQARLDLIAQLTDAGKLLNPQVSVNLLQSQRRRYTILGNVGRPGAYSIQKPDFRLLDAAADAGGLPPQQKSLYVIRTVTRKSQPAPAEALPEPAAPADAATQSHPGNGFHLMAGMRGTAAEPPATTGASPESMPTIKPLLPPPTSKPTPSDDELQQALERSDSPTPPMIYDEARKGWVQAKPSAGRKPPAHQASGPARPAAPTGSSPVTATGSEPTTGNTPVDWESLTGAETLTRVIEIPIEPLMAGDHRYNIVIRPSDIIHVSPGSVGEFYVMGNVNRPGAYQLTGREITIREAIAASGGFGPLAMPSQAELIRRGRGDETETRSIDLDAIFAGRTDDFYIRPNDIINIGTNPLMPFLAVIRNAFRVSYGFGFVYDRNFADIDSFSGKQNPSDRRRAERLQQGFPP